MAAVRVTGRATVLPDCFTQTPTSPTRKCSTGIPLKNKLSLRHNGILLSRKKNDLMPLGSNMDGSRDDHTAAAASLQSCPTHHTKQRQISHDITCVWNLKSDTNELICKMERDSQTRKQTYGNQTGKGGRGKLGQGSHTLLCCLVSCVHSSRPVDCSPPGSLSMGFSRQEHWSGWPCPPPGDLPDPGTEPWSPALRADS